MEERIVKVKDIITKLGKYNKEAEFLLVVNGKEKEFEIWFGSGEGCKPENCEKVCFAVDTLYEVIE